jgi:hypothetical protein
MELVARGVPAFKGHKRPVPHAADHYYALFATAAGNRGDEPDSVSQHDSMTQLMTLKILGKGKAENPWETFEQPSYSSYYGRRPGTITLNQWAASSSVLPQSIDLRDPGVSPRDVDLEKILGRIKELERGLEEDDPDLMYKNLYRRFLRDPDKLLSPHKTIDRQITDLIVILSRPDWIDFTIPRHQIVTRFIFDPDPANTKNFVKFFHQLLFSIELDARINSKHHLEEFKEKLLLQIPPTIQWNLALARRWRDFVRIEGFGPTPDQLRLRLKLKRRQVKMLKRFAQMMKWPNLANTLETLKKREDDSTLDLISSHAMAFFSGLVLPGPTFPFLIMNSLIDIDPDRATDELALLTHLHPHCGFQYRNSYTYWAAISIVGKVLAPTCHSIAGWVGPAPPTVDLARSQIARIRSHTSTRQRPLTPEDVLSMSERSDPLGPPAQVFPVGDYALVEPRGLADVDPAIVRIELLALRPCGDRADAPGPTWFDASVQFAVDGRSCPMALTYDVSFINAWPCSDGPHALFLDYPYEAIRADELVDMKDWTGSRRKLKSKKLNGHGNSKGKGKATDHDDDSDDNDPLYDEEKVLVIEAFGVPDTEVLARAWCASLGLSAVVADMGKTW